MNQHIYQRRPVNDSAIPNVIFFIMIANGLVYALQRLLGPNNFLDQYLALWPVGSPWADFYPWQLLTYGFMHSDRDILHIVFNLFMLWMFGRELEGLMGPRRFLTYYITCVVGAGIVQLIVAGMQGGGYPTVGASGGVMGVLLAFGMAFPNRMLMLMFPPIPMKAKYMVMLFAAMDIYLGFSGQAPNIANFAHLGGMLFGFLLIQRWKKTARR